jgi:DNA mismatch repair protein MutS2
LPELREGVKVKLRDVSGPATVRRIVNAELIEVEVGLLKMQVAKSEVLEVLTAAEAAKKSLPSGVTFKPAERAEGLTRELNLIGKTSAEAQGEIERFLDTAMLAEVYRVRIVHGHGTGVLRRLVQEMLGTHPAVAAFHAAPQNEGGAGATIVELR